MLALLLLLSGTGSGATSIATSGGRPSGVSAVEGEWRPVSSGAPAPGPVSQSRQGGPLWLASQQLAYRSDDRGIGWAPALAPGHWPARVVPDVTRPELLYAQMPGSLALWRSRDGGITWEERPLPQTELIRSTVDPLPRLGADGALWWVPGTVESVAVSRDQGDSWQMLPHRFERITDIVPSPLDPDRLWVRDGRTWQRSDDGGVTWVELGAFGRFQPDPFDPAVLWRLDDGAALLRASDAGANWQSIGIVGGPPDPPTGIVAATLLVDPARTGRLVVVARRAVGVQPTEWLLSVSDDGGATWTAGPPPPLLADDAVTSLSGAGGSLFLGAESGLYRLGPGGEWTVPTGLNARPFRQVYGVAYPTGAGELVGVHDVPDPPCQNPADQPPGVAKRSVSRDSGLTWSVEPALVQAREVVIDPRDRRRAYLMAYGTIYRSEDGGITWLESAAPFPDPLHPFNAIALDPTDPEMVWAGRTFWLCDLKLPVRPLPQAPTLWRSRDRGRTWQGVPFGGDRPRAVYAIGLDAAHPGRLFVASDRLLRSDDAGATWVEVALPPEAERDVLASVLVGPLDADALWVGTWRSGLFASGDGGATWRRVLALPPDLGARLFVHPTDPRALYAATLPGRRVFGSGDAGATWADLNGPFTLASPRPVASIDQRGLSVPLAQPDRLYTGGAGGTWVRPAP